MSVRVTRSVRFSAAHREAERVLGHDYRVDVTLSGDPDPLTGMFVNLAELDRRLRELVVAPLQGSMLEQALGTQTVSCEGLTLWLARRLDGQLEGLVRVRVWENSDLFAEWEA